MMMEDITGFRFPRASQAATAGGARDDILETEAQRLWKGVTCGALCSLIWGVQAVVSRQSVADGLTAADVTILRFLAATLVLLPFGLRLRPFPVGRLGWRRTLVLTCLAGGPYSAILVGGSAFAPAIHTAVISPGLIPLMSALQAWLFLSEPASPSRLIGIGIIMVGIVVFSFDAVTGAGARAGAWRGDLLFVLNATLWAAFGLLARRWNVDAVEGTTAICIVSLMTLPLWVPFLPLRLMEASMSAVLLQAAYQGALVGALSLILYTRCVTLLGPMRASLFVPLVPIVTAIGGILLLGELPSALEWIGMLTVIGGMAVAMNLRRG
jgi:drug/metabolite transporter (DMT)-like permease